MLVAPFSGVNESTWEHMKLLFWPMLIFALSESIFFRTYTCFWHIKMRGIILGTVLIPVLFYTYNGVVGESPDWVNILIFFISAAAVYVYETRMLSEDTVCYTSPYIPSLTLCILSLLFIIFTFCPPHLAIFKDPVTGGHGIQIFYDTPLHSPIYVLQYS